MITTPRVVIVCIVAALIGSGLVTAFMRPAKVVAAATPAAELPSAEGVRIVPIYRKIEEQAPQEPVPVAVTAIDKPPSAPVIPKAKNDTTLALAEPQADEPDQLASRHRHIAQNDGDDICVRHHLHKVFTNNGKSWRCK
jgi:hypothetical protein